MQKYLIQLADSDLTIPCEQPDTVLRAALRSGIGFPYECSSGGCGSCAFELLAGELTELWSSAPGLSLRARERGLRLACQSAPAGDCLIKVRSKAECVPPVVPRRHIATLVRARPLTHDISEFQLRTEAAAEFLPGQYALLDIAGVAGSRCYSMSNLANTEGDWHFIVKRVPGGAATNILFDQLSPGAQIGLDGPYGMSYLRTDSARDIVCIAGGSGISPVMSILRAAVREPRLAGRTLSLFYGGRSPRDICSTGLISEDPILRGRVICHEAISDPACTDDWTGSRGFIHEIVQSKVGDRIRDLEFYFCGPPPMINALQRMLIIDHKVPAAQLHFDRFL